MYDSRAVWGHVRLQSSPAVTTMLEPKCISHMPISLAKHPQLSCIEEWQGE